MVDSMPDLDKLYADTDELDLDKVIKALEDDLKYDPKQHQGVSERIAMQTYQRRVTEIYKYTEIK